MIHKQRLAKTDALEYIVIEAVETAAQPDVNPSATTRVRWQSSHHQ